jgi:hypothetical protein
MRVLSLALPFCFSGAGSGCQSLNHYRPAPILVCDADTKKPIPDAVVWVSYPFKESSLAPKDMCRTTGSDGVAQMVAAPYGKLPLQVLANADGYMEETRPLPLDTVGALKPAHLFEAVNLRPAVLTVELYPHPLPKIELILPAGYRGIVKVKVDIQEDAPCPPGQRIFSYPVPSSGVAEITGPAILRHAFAPSFTLRYENGEPLPMAPKPVVPPNQPPIGFWWLKSEGGYEHFLIGTPEENANLAPTTPKTGDDHRATGGGGGHRRGGRRGG